MWPIWVDIVRLFSRSWVRLLLMLSSACSVASGISSLWGVWKNKFYIFDKDMWLLMLNSLYFLSINLYYSTNNKITIMTKSKFITWYDWKFFKIKLCILRWIVVDAWSRNSFCHVLLTHLFSSTDIEDVIYHCIIICPFVHIVSNFTLLNKYLLLDLVVLARIYYLVVLVMYLLTSLFMRDCILIFDISD